MFIILPIKRSLTKDGYYEYTFKAIFNYNGSFCERTEAFANQLGVRYNKRSKVAKVATDIGLKLFILSHYPKSFRNENYVVFCENNVNI